MSQAQGGLQASPDFLTPIATPPLANIFASPAKVAALASAGTPVPKGTLVVDPAAWLIYGQSDGLGGVAPLGVNTDYTAAQIQALASASGLTPYATYIPSDADPAYQLWARSASEFGSMMGGDVVQVQIAGSVGATIEVSP